jgi:oligopeptide/dipeptide ABC transporter ATP-binding protein
LEAVPRLGDLDLRRKIKPITGSVPNVFAPPPGCRFHPRCPVADPAQCASKAPPRFEAHGHFVECIHGQRELSS